VIQILDIPNKLTFYYLKVPLNGYYYFHLSCDDECELWVKQYQENGLLIDQEGINGEVGQLLVQIQKWASYNDSQGYVYAIHGKIF
jgi:hypothetical protein